MTQHIIFNLLVSLVEAGELEGQNISYMGQSVVPVGDDALEPDSIYDHNGLSTPDENGLVRVKLIDEQVVPKIREELGDEWANKVPQFFALWSGRMKDLGYELNEQQHLSLSINGEYAFFTRMPLALMRRIEPTDKPGRRFKFNGIIPNARFVRDDEATPERIAVAVHDFIYAAWKKSQSPVDFSPAGGRRP